ncbi:multimerin-2 isoform X1 [Phascolarctos cinereus]|uniref:Multimerin-2 n=1 Tax=Phascolarctos cinereus TaxID=38626 RepID=A0A6P5KWG7_PHACI|nr:multimerin-2 [Phascolarctos cinereus]
MGPLLLCLWGLLGSGALAAWAADPRHHGGYPQGDYGPSPYPPRSPSPPRTGKQEAGVPFPLPLIPPHQAEDGPKDPWRSNWCPYRQSRLVTFVASCKTEKFFVHSQQPCPPGTPDCQVKVMYRISLKPVYQVKQKVHTSVVWKCCPGYTGADCQHYDSSLISKMDDQSKGKENPWEEALEHKTAPLSREPMELRRTTEQQESLLEDLQNDIHQATSDLLDLQNSLESNHTTKEIKANLTGLGSVEQSLQQVLLPHVETFLKNHFSPIWRSFNESLHNLSHMLRNLSRDVEANRQNIERFQEIAVAKADFQDLGTKFESKVQENILKVNQLRQDIDSQLHDQQLALNHNLSVIKADTDLKVKKIQKTQEIHLLLANASTVDYKEEQEDLQVKLGQLQSNLSELSFASGKREDEVLSALRQFNETLAKHEEEIKELFMDSDENFELGTRLERQVNTMQNNKAMIEELRVILMEKSLIMEETKEDFERQILDLNYTLHHLQGSHSDLMKYVKDCNCQKLYFDLSLLREDQRNATRFLEETHLTLEDQKMLESSSIKALRNAVEDLALSVDAQKEEITRAKVSLASLKGQVQALVGEVDGLKRVDRHVFREIRHLNNSFNSLLEDALKHQTVLTTLFGEEMLEEITEEENARLPLSYLQIEDALDYTSNRLKEHTVDLMALRERVDLLESVDEGGPLDSGQAKAGALSRVEHLEPNHEASDGGGLQENDLANLKSEITHLSIQMEKYESQIRHSQGCCHPDGILPLNLSVESLQSDVKAMKQDVGQHLQLFQSLFGNYRELVATNVSLDLGKVQSVLRKKEKKQHREEESHRKRDKKQVEKWGEPPFPGSGRIDQAPKFLGEEPSVAFYAGFPQGTHGLRRPVKFNATYLNVGGGYFPEHGFFRAPERGVYLITVTAEFGPGLGEGQLVLGGRLRTSVSSGSEDPTAAGGSTAATLAVAELQKGERVWFELTKGSLARREPSGSALGGFLVFKT